MFELIFIFYIWEGSLSIHQMDEPFATEKSCNTAGILVMRAKEAYRKKANLRTGHRGYYVCVPVDSPSFLKKLEGYNNGNK